MTRNFGLLFALIATQAATLSMADAFKSDLAVEVICSYRQSPEASLCPRLSHLTLSGQWHLSPNLQASLSVDPFHQPKKAWYDSAGLELQKHGAPDRWLADYSLRVGLHPAWDLSVESWQASTFVPDGSTLSFASALQDSGWDQSVLHLRFHPKDFHKLTLGFILGLGEGEQFATDDQSTYSALTMSVETSQALFLKLGASFDRNSLNEEQLWWLPTEDRQVARQDFQAKRFAAALQLDGSLPSAQGLRASLGWQLNEIRNGRQQNWDLARAYEEGALDPTELLPQTLGGQGSVYRELLFASLSYRILAEYIVALHAGILHVKLDDDALLRSCSQIDTKGHCEDPGGRHRSLALKALSYGLGKRDDDGWLLMLEVHQQRYDRFYELYHFAANGQERQKSFQIFNLRLEWLL